MDEATRGKLVSGIAQKILAAPVAELPRGAWDDLKHALHALGGEWGIAPEVTEEIFAELQSAVRAATVFDFALN